MKRHAAPAPALDLEPAPQAPAEGQSNAFLASLLALRAGSGSLPWRGAMEEAFGEDFGGVGVSLGVPLLQQLGVEGVAMEEQVLFASARPSREVVAHELAHVLQHRNGSGSGLGAEAGSAEREAESASKRVAAGESVQIEGRADGEVQCMLFDLRSIFSTAEQEELSESDKKEIIDLKEMVEPINAHIARVERDFRTAYDRGLPEGDSSPAAAARALVSELEALKGALSGLYGPISSATSLWNRSSRVEHELKSLVERVGKEIADLLQQADQYDAWADWISKQTWQDEPWERSFEAAAQQTWDLGHSPRRGRGDDWAYNEIYSASPAEERRAAKPGISHQDLQRKMGGIASCRTAGYRISERQTGDWLYLYPQGARNPVTRVSSRIYLNPHPQFIPEVLEQLLPHMGYEADEGVELEPQQQQAPAHELKVCDPIEQGHRTDQIVLYVYAAGDEEPLQEVLRLQGVLTALQAKPLRGPLAAKVRREGVYENGTWADLFRKTIAPTTQPLGLKGISCAPHPQNGKSYGETRMDPMRLAVEDCMAAGDGQDRYRSRLVRRIQEEGIDPRHPWQLGPEAPALARKPAPPKRQGPPIPKRTVARPPNPHQGRGK